MNIIRSWLLVILIVTLAGCKTIGDNAPAAQTPSGVTVSAILTQGGGWTQVGPYSTNPNTYKILPTGLPSGGFQLFFYAPYPALLQLTIDGVVLPKFEDIPTGADPAVTGFYRIVNINPNPSTPYWNIAVRPPKNLLTRMRYEVGVASVSINPKFRDASGKNQVSPPLNLVMTTQSVNKLAVVFLGDGRGNVSIHAEGDVNSTPLDTFFDVERTLDFGNLYNITLNAHPSANSAFIQWSGACSGAGTTCRLHLNGEAKAVAVTFSKSGGGTGTAQSCPPVVSLAGFTFFNLPLCDSQNIFNDPAPDLECDAQGYYCCAISNGNSDPKCGGMDHKSFPASCIGFGNPKVKLEPSGCYIQN